MKKRLFILFTSLFLLSGCKNHESVKPIEQDPLTIKEEIPTEQFIQETLMTEDGRLHTNMTDRKEEYLSESLGLWMDYLVLKNDHAQFEQQVAVLTKHFLTKDHLVIWEINEGKSAPANAFIDDLRIGGALYEAGEQWQTPDYTKLADQMSQALVQFQTSEQLMVDFVELESKAKGTDVTLSYPIPNAFEAMKKADILPAETYNQTKKLLVEAPFSNEDLFPKAYHIPTGEYLFDAEVNMIDQFYTGYHRAKWGGDVDALVNFAKMAFNEGNGKLFGRYDHLTNQPIVAYESAAVYALAILMCLEIDEEIFAKELYTQMKTLQVNEGVDRGGYIDVLSKDTHTFDNLLALIVERRMLDL